MKRCPGCGESKSLSEFGNNAARPDGVQSECRSCRKRIDQGRWEKHGARIQQNRSTEEGRRKRQAARHGLTLEQLDALIAKYDGLCWICRETPGIAVDHCHTTERRRGWLCHPCNAGLGYFRDNAERLRAAAQYLG